MVRYMVQKPHLAWSFPAGTNLEYLDVCADSDRALKETERKRSSCVVIRLGQSVLKTSSTTQGVISLSSCEAELYAATRGGSMRYPTSVSCTQRFSRSSRHDDEAWICWVKPIDIKALLCQETMERVLPNDESGK